MKTDAFVKRLDNISRFIKEKYILEQRDLKISIKDLFTEYVNFCISIGSRPMTKIDLNKKLNELLLMGYKSGNIAVKFNYTNSYLLDVAKKNKWLHVTDQFDLTGDEIFSDSLDKNINDDDDDDDDQINKINDKKTIEKLQKRIKELENINNLQISNLNPKIKKQITNQEFDEDLDLLFNMC
jgi:hypothetical protein